MTSERPDTPPRSPRPLAPPGFLALFRAHWLARLGAKAIVLGVAPLLIYLLYERVTGFEGQNHEGFGILALVGITLGVLLLAAGAIAAGLERVRVGDATGQRE